MSELTFRRETQLHKIGGSSPEKASTPTRKKKPICLWTTYLSEEKAETQRKMTCSWSSRLESREPKSILPAKREMLKPSAMLPLPEKEHWKKMAESQMFGPSYNPAWFEEAKQKQGESVARFYNWSQQNLKFLMDKMPEVPDQIRLDPRSCNVWEMFCNQMSRWLATKIFVMALCPNLQQAMLDQGYTML